ncbi:hypothetical protein SteCoe_1655 [Stentor coeruleus]|uniref:Uncharacterized protein n=1 Tax=Stentor coeruleus TaxID=5963 RepID=A0A1R2D1I1_9CILI|nr:hypothetical protein SteCoe_1655 [Stentor coeruleus]
MEVVYKNLVHVLESLKSATGSELSESLSFVLKVLKTDLPIPQSILKIVLVRTCAITKSKYCEVQCFEILELLITSPFFHSLYEADEENNMTLTILLSALVVNIEKEGEFRKPAWKILSKSLEGINDHIIKACFPGLVKISVEEVKKFRCQGIGSTTFSLDCCLKVINKISDIIINCKDEWKDMALSKVSNVFGIILKESCEIATTKEGFDKTNMLKAIENSVKISGSKDSKVFGCILTLSSETHIETDIEIPSETYKNIFLTYIKTLADISDSTEKIRTLSLINNMILHLGDDCVYMFSIHKMTIYSTLLKIFQLVLPLNIDNWSILRCVKYAENSSVLLQTLETFIQYILQYDIYDLVLEEQLKLIKNVKKKMDTEILQNLITLSFILSYNYTDHSMHIINEIIFLKDPNSNLPTLIKFLYVFWTKKQLFDNSITEPEAIENTFYAYTAETKSQCDNFLEEIGIWSEKNGIKEVIVENEGFLQKALIMKMMIFGPEEIGNSLICYFEYRDCVEAVEKVGIECLKGFDEKHLRLSSKKIQGYLKFFLDVIDTIKGIVRKRGKKLEKGNFVRNVVLRVRGMLALKAQDVENRKVMHLALQVFMKSLELIDKVPFEIDHSDHSAFAFEEDANVSIPNGLTELSYEFLTAFTHCLKSMADSNCLAITQSLLDTFILITSYEADFFETDNRFGSKIFPYLKVMLKSKAFTSAFQSKIKSKILDFLMVLSKKSLLQIHNDLEECMKIIDSGDCEDVKAKCEKLKSKLKD